MSASVWLIIPTYNEAVNLERIVAAARSELSRVAAGSYRILVVDDNSPDGTGAIADVAGGEPATTSRSCTGPARPGLVRPTWPASTTPCAPGRRWSSRWTPTSPMTRGISRRCWRRPAAPTWCSAPATSPGGGVRDWGLARQLISRGGGLYARLILGVGVHDLTGGFKVIHRRVLEAIDLPSVRAEGYVFQIEVTYRAVLAGFTVAEVPIVFADRTAGKSRCRAESHWRRCSWSRRSGATRLPRCAARVSMSRVREFS